MARGVGRRVLVCAAVIAGGGGALLFAAQSLKAEVESSTRPSRAEIDVSRLKDYLAEINLKGSAPAHADSTDDIARLQNYLQFVRQRKGQSNILVAQAGKDDLLTPAPSGSPPSGSK